MTQKIVAHIWKEKEDINEDSLDERVWA